MENLIYTALSSSNSDDSNVMFNDNLSRYIYNFINDEINLLNNYSTLSSSISDSSIIPEIMLRLSFEELPVTVTFTNVTTADTNDTPRRLLNRQIINNFKKIIITDALDCHICLDHLLRGSCVKVLPCNHSFCIDCIEKWLSEYSSKCPVCNFDYYESSSS